MSISEIVASLGAVVGVFAAIVSGIFALRSEKSAKQVEVATKRLADAAEKANEIQLSSLPIPQVIWSDAIWRSGDTFSIKNTGTAAAFVHSLVAEPFENANLLTVRTQLPCVVQPGDSIEFMKIATFQGDVDPVIFWALTEDAQHFERARRSAIKPR